MVLIMGKDKKTPPYEATEKVPLSDEDKKKAGRHFYRSGKNQDEQQSGNAVIDNIPPSSISINEGAETSTELELKESPNNLSDDENEERPSEGFNQAAMQALDALHLQIESLQSEVAEIKKTVSSSQINTGQEFAPIDRSKKRSPILVEVPVDLVEKLNDAVKQIKAKGTKVSRQAFIIKAITDKLDNL